MAKNLNGLAIVAPAGNIEIGVTDSFDMTLAPSFSGAGTVNDYTLQWEWDQGTSTWAAIGTNTEAGLYHAATNPITTNTESNSTLVITAGASGTFNIRGNGNSGSYYTSELQVTVTAAGTTLTVADAACVTAADAVVLYAVPKLVVADAYVETQADAVSTTKSDTLVIADAYCETQADAVSTTKSDTLSIADAYVTTQADGVVVTSGGLDLVVDNAYVTTQADAAGELVQSQIYTQPDAWVSDGIWASVFIGV